MLKQFSAPSQQFSPTTEFLQRVSYIPNPSIIAPNNANGIRTNIFVLRPIQEINSIHIKRSQFQSTEMINLPLAFGFWSNETISRGRRSDALSHFMAKVLGHTKSLFRITMSVVCVKIRSWCPLPSTRNSLFLTCISNETFEFGSFSFSFIGTGRSAQLDVALTPIMQSPWGVRCVSFVISIVLWWFERIFSCPEKDISNIIKYKRKRRKLILARVYHGVTGSDRTQNCLVMGRV